MRKPLTVPTGKEYGNCCIMPYLWGTKQIPQYLACRVIHGGLTLGKLMEPFEVKTGVRQGCSLTPFCSCLQ